MIGNTDFAFSGLHNVELHRHAERATTCRSSYDFDFSGAVNARYATVDPQLRDQARARPALSRLLRAARGVSRRCSRCSTRRRIRSTRSTRTRIGKLLRPDIVDETLEVLRRVLQDDQRPEMRRSTTSSMHASARNDASRRRRAAPVPDGVSFAASCCRPINLRRLRPGRCRAGFAADAARRSLHRDLYLDTTDDALRQRGIVCRLRAGADGRAVLVAPHRATRTAATGARRRATGGADVAQRARHGQRRRAASARHRRSGGAAGPRRSRGRSADSIGGARSGSGARGSRCISTA